MDLMEQLEQQLGSKQLMVQLHLDQFMVDPSQPMGTRQPMDKQLVKQLVKQHI